MPQSTPPSVQDLLAAESHAVPAPLAEDSWVDQGTGDIPRSRYTSPEFAALENEFLWTRTWQMACMEVEVAEPGDYMVYDVADQSVLVVRTPDGTLKGYHNSCLHRGTKLRTEGGRASSFRCPFHGWRWDLEGTLVELPAEWDFPQIWGDPLASCLPEVQVATWAGFVFINMDPGAEAFDSYASKLIEHFAEAFDFGLRFQTFHAVKEVPANWKVCMEAFSEAYHVIATHPQILEFCADTNSQYSLWPESPHVTRFHNPFAAQSPHLDDMTEQEISE
ncbi:MAG: aromatic ring-hydroxylating oxygenase subunit alpha, partial [Acidimicrobiales bacterium]